MKQSGYRFISPPGNTSKIPREDPIPSSRGFFYLCEPLSRRFRGGNHAHGVDWRNDRASRIDRVHRVENLCGHGRNHSFDSARSLKKITGKETMKKTPDFKNIKEIVGCTAIASYVFYLVCPYCSDPELTVSKTEHGDRPCDNDITYRCAVCDRNVVIKHHRETEDGQLSSWCTFCEE